MLLCVRVHGLQYALKKYSMLLCVWVQGLLQYAQKNIQALDAEKSPDERGVSDAETNTFTMMVTDLMFLCKHCSLRLL